MEKEIFKFRERIASARSGLKVDTFLRWSHGQAAEGWRGLLLQQIGLLVLTIRSLDKSLTMRAAGLTYRSLLAMVPLLVVAFAIFGAFGGLEQMREPLVDWIFENLTVRSDDGLREDIDAFLANVNAGAIAGAGAIGLVYTAIGLLVDVESSINRMWGIKKGRSFLVSLARNWALITLAPLLVAYSISLSSSLQSSSFATTVLEWLPFGLGASLLSLSTVAAMSLVFTMAFVIIPNTRVRIKAAAAGGILAGILWSVLKSIFIISVASSVRYSAVYGALGTLPIFMVWMYFGWIVTLLGARFAYANQVGSVTHAHQIDSLMSHAEQEKALLEIVFLVSADFLLREDPPDESEIAKRAQLPLPVVRHLVRVLSDQKVLAPVMRGKTEGLIPAIPLNEATPSDVLNALADWSERGFEFLADTHYYWSDELIEQANSTRHRELTQKNLHELTLEWLDARQMESVLTLEPTAQKKLRGAKGELYRQRRIETQPESKTRPDEPDP